MLEGKSLAVIALQGLFIFVIIRKKGGGEINEF